MAVTLREAATLSNRIAQNLAAERAKAEARRHQTKRRRERRKRAKAAAQTSKNAE